jgi:hypothetical protein
MFGASLQLYYLFEPLEGCSWKAMLPTQNNLGNDCTGMLHFVCLLPPLRVHFENQGMEPSYQGV